MLIIKNKLQRKEKKLISKIKSPKLYKILIWFIFIIFGFKKKYLSFRKNKKNSWIISITSDNILGTKFSYIDDLIVDKKIRGKWIWKILFSKVLENAEKEKSDYIFLVTKKDRNISYNMYKKYGFSLITVWIWYLAYKKINKK